MAYGEVYMVEAELIALCCYVPAGRGWRRMRKFGIAGLLTSVLIVLAIFIRPLGLHGRYNSASWGRRNYVHEKRAHSDARRGP